MTWHMKTRANDGRIDLSPGTDKYGVVPQSEPKFVTRNNGLSPAMVAEWFDSTRGDSFTYLKLD